LAQAWSGNQAPPPIKMASSESVGQIRWDPFNDPNDAVAGRRTEYVEETPDRLVAMPHAGAGDWNPFEDPDMLELMGDIAVVSDDVEAIEVWIEQAVIARVPADRVQPKRDRARDLRLREADMAKRKVMTGEQLDGAMQSRDREGLRAAISKATAAGAHPDRLEAACQRLEALKRADVERLRKEAVESEANFRSREGDLLTAADGKLARRQLVPSAEVDLLDDEMVALERRHRRYVESLKGKVAGLQSSMTKKSAVGGTIHVKFNFLSGEVEMVQMDLADKGMCLLTKLVPLRRKHKIPENLGLFLPSGEPVDLARPLGAQGVHDGCAVRVDDAVLGAKRPDAAAEAAAAAGGREESEEEQVDTAALEEELKARQEAERWVPVYWPIAYTKPSSAWVQEALGKHQQVVVLGWGATEDPEVMKQSVDAVKALGGTLLLISGPATPPDIDFPMGEAEATGVPLAFLKLPVVARGVLMAKAVQRRLEEAGVKGSYALVAVSRCFQNRRLVLTLGEFGCQAPRSAQKYFEKPTIIPYCADPLRTILPDVQQRKKEILVEAFLMSQLERVTFGPEAKERLSELAIEVFARGEWPRDLLCNLSSHPGYWLREKDEEPPEPKPSAAPSQPRGGTAGRAIAALEANAAGRLRGSASDKGKDIATATSGKGSSVTAPRDVRSRSGEKQYEALRGASGAGASSSSAADSSAVVPPRSDTRPPLMLAARDNDLERVQMLLERGREDPNLADAAGETALFEALAIGSADITACLLMHSANPLQRSLNGMVAADLADNDAAKTLLNIFQGGTVTAEARTVALDALSGEMRRQWIRHMQDRVIKNMAKTSVR